MKKGFGYYFKDGFRTSRRVFRKKEFNTFKYFLFQFASLLGVLCVFITPFFSLAKVKMVEQAVNDETIHLYKSFENTDSPKKYLNSLLSIVLKIVLFIGGLLILSVVGVGLFIIGYAIDILLTYADSIFYSVILLAPVAVGAIFFIIYFCLYTDATNYFINSYSEATGSQSLQYSYNTLRKKGKFTVFLINFLKVLLNALMIGIMVYACLSLLYTRNVYGMIIEIAIAVVVFFLYIWIFPKFNFALSIAKYNLYRDIEAIDNPNLKFKANEEGTNIELKDDVNEDKVLLQLFDECDKLEETAETRNEENTVDATLETTQEEKTE